MGEGIGTEDSSTRVSCCSVIRPIGKPRARYDISCLQSEQVVVPYEGRQRRHGQGMEMVDVGAAAAPPDIGGRGVGAKTARSGRVLAEDPVREQPYDGGLPCRV
ncbi:hypothetical protein N4G69_45715 [Streptomyces mirabilis]|uniref:hypothetical protein n=1 Tax=Streptomyces mirabilis TaxID=68239 RepID=UPI0021BF2903|nr:hypothetical protein [Streptomyces mirabilis]MCT9112767.1 hypothetical protein [Streptomyces mirabilis]